MVIRRSHRRLDSRGGVFLDFVLVTAFVLLGAFTLNALGLTFGQIMHGAAHFFGV
jgi:hypothetical protein